jgi:flagellar biosynthesis protein FlhF
MQVKKFEAKTMKEALEMVKNQLGPDAIILGARDNNKSFGLLGKSSVEITAAISETALQKKKFAESRMNEQARARFRSASAQIQRQVVEKSVSRFADPAESRRIFTQIPYADIVDDEAQAVPDVLGRRVDSLLQDMTADFEDGEEKAEDKPEESRASRRIKSAAKAAAQVFENQVEKAIGKSSRPEDAAEIRRLQEEVSHLRQFIQQLQSLPRTVVNGHPGATLGVNYEGSFMFEKLTSGGIGAEIAAELMKRAAREIPLAQQKNKNLMEAWTAHQIMNSIAVADPARIGRVNAFVGGAGQGKTSALVKLGGYLVGKQKKKVLLVAAGNLRVGALDQLKIYSHLLNAQLDTVKTAADWPRILAQHADCDHILVDCPGSSLKTDVEVAALKSLLPPYTDERRVHFVQSVSAKDGDAHELYRRYLPLRPDDLIFSYLDESANHGLIYNLQKNFNVPLFAFGTGAQVPDDFEWATRERLLDLIFKLKEA